MFTCHDELLNQDIRSRLLYEVFLCLCLKECIAVVSLRNLLHDFNLSPGNPDPLVFHAPQIFFDCLQQRISAGSKKKRLPNFTTGFLRKDALPLGTFTKYTWHISNILHVKQIFDTPEVKYILHVYNI